MFDTVEVVRFDRMMTTGKTKPMLLACERSDGTEVEVVAKFFKHCGVGGLIREAVGSMFALDLGLFTPEPFLVSASEDFVNSIENPAALEALENAGGFGFGSRRLPNSFAQWIRDMTMPSAVESEALSVVAFDCLITNGDRMAERPNLLTNGNRIAVIDHELGFMTTLNLFWKAPWTDDALIGSHPPLKHVFHAHFAKRFAYDLKSFEERLLAVEDARIDSYYLSLPSAWTSSTDAADIAIQLIRDLRDNALSAIAQTKKALA